MEMGFSMIKARIAEDQSDRRRFSRLPVELEAKMRELGASGPSYDTIVATGPINAPRPHHRPTPTVVEEGHTVIIDVGRADGIEVDQPLVTLEGLVGKTVDVGRSASEVMLYSHPEFSASAMLVGGDHLEYGVVRSAPNGDVELYLPLRSRSAAGDRIVTSGYGGTFPRGIPIGTVERGREDERLGLQKIDVVRPVVDLGSLGAAFVLRRVVGPGESVGDVPRLYWPGYAYPPMAGETFGRLAGDSVRADSAASDTAAAALYDRLGWRLLATVEQRWGPDRPVTVRCYAAAP